MPLGEVVIAALGGRRREVDEGLTLDRTDGADLSVDNSKLGGVVKYGMNMESRVCGLPAELAQAMIEFFLKLVCKVVLGAKERHATL